MTKRFFSFVLFAVLLLAFPLTVFGNAAEPSFLQIIVENPPEDLKISIEIDGTEFSPKITSRSWEKYYRFFESDFYDSYQHFYPEKAVLVARTDEKELRFNVSEFFMEKYGIPVLLDLEKETIENADTSLRTAKLVALRVGLTFLLEGFVFLLFRMRNKRSWLIFVITNLATQLFLNIQLSEQGIFAYSAGLLLFVLEILIIIAESLVFYFLVPEFKEKYKRQIFSLLYVFSANILSWALGGFLISNFPI